MRAHSRYFFGAILFVLGVFVSQWASAEDDKKGPFFAVIEENDFLSNPFKSNQQDRHYTHGLKFIYMGGEERMPQWVNSLSRSLPKFGINAPIKYAGVVVGQNIYTPDDLRSTTIVPDDRPYAGWLYAGAVLIRRGETPAQHVPVMESFEINFGVIGPEALSEEGQENIHRWRFPDDIPKGWDNQLGTEPGVVFKYGRLWKIVPLSERMRISSMLDLIPHLGLSLGNIQTFAAVGGTFRFGWNLPDDFGVQIIDSTTSIHGGYDSNNPAWGFHLFGRVEGRAVANNIFLDGNTYRKSHRVDKNYFVADFSFGLLVQLTRHIDASFTRVVRTEEFKGQNGNDIFGGLSVKSMFRF